VTKTSTLDLVSLFPALLGTYGDGGNISVLQRRCAWRGIDVRVIKVDATEPVPSTGDIYVIGGGEDGSQLAGMKALQGNQGTSSGLSTALDAGAQLLAVCAGMQLLGHSFSDASGASIPGLGLLDVTTTRLRVRAVGEVLATPDPTLGLPVLSGFENHGGHTRLGPDAQPLATVLRGTGNGPASGRSPSTEGAVAGGIIATYLHGPVLARNPALADLLIARALGVPAADLAPLDLPEHAALRERLRADPAARP
jgi:CobQ-like glutamine amidotransferase family enzyme